MLYKQLLDGIIFLISINLSCLCKLIATYYFNRRKFNKYFLYHSLWHLFFPLGGVYSVRNIINK